MPHDGLHPGDLIVGIVRRPDPVPCPNCAVGEWDMCRNGRYTERGIKQIDGFMSERWRIEPGFYTKMDPTLGVLGVLLEPTTVVAKAWEQVAAMRARAFWEPRTALVTGAGPIGLLAALLGVQLGLDVHVLDRATTGSKPRLVHDLGATYHSGSVTDIGFEPDVIIECTGVGQVIVDSIRQVGAGGVVCLTGVGTGGRTTGLPAADVATELVLQNNVIVGSVNANRRHFYRAAQALSAADRDWLGQLISRRVPPRTSPLLCTAARMTSKSSSSSAREHQQTTIGDCVRWAPHDLCPNSSSGRVGHWAVDSEHGVAGRRHGGVTSAPRDRFQVDARESEGVMASLASCCRVR